MLKEFLSKFKKLPESNKAMIYLMWIYNAGGIISTIFINIYIFSFNKEILDVLIYNLIFVFNIFIGFSVIGFILSFYNKNIKNMYYFAYFFYILAFIIIFLLKGNLGIYLFGIIFGLGFGMFWCAVHSQELINIEDKTRDIYSSIIYTGKTIINIVVPLMISAIFLIVNYFFDFSAYIILFLFLPIIYSLSFIFINKIGDYFPDKIKKSDIKNFFNIKNNIFSHIYFLFDGFLSGIYWSLFPIISITLLKTEINVGLLEGIIGIISTFVIIFTSSKRKINNRLYLLGIISFFLFINVNVFVFNFNIIGFLIFMLIGIILNPLYKISEHVFKLKLIDSIKIKGNDFFAPMILREVDLAIGRFSIILLFIYLLYLGFSTIEILKIGLSLTGVFFILIWIALYLNEKK